MSTPDTAPGSTNSKGIKTLAVRLEPDLHAQLSLIAQLRGSTITDEIREALQRHITAVKESPEIAGKADSVLEEIERDAAARRDAIATLFGNSDSAPADPSASSRPRGRKPGTGSAS